MKKEYTKLTREVFDENMEPAGEVEEMTITSLIADEGKVFRCLGDGFVGGTRIDLGTHDSEENYEEVDDPKYAERQAAEQEVVDRIVKEVRG